MLGCQGWSILAWGDSFDISWSGFNLHLSTLDQRPSDTLGKDLTSKTIPIISIVVIHLPTGLKQIRRSNEAI
jgi:hypothetical protein